MELCSCENRCALPEDFKKTLICLTSDLERKNKLLDETLCALIRWFLDQSAEKILSRGGMSNIKLQNLQDLLINLSCIDISYGCTYRQLYFLTYGKYPIGEEIKDEQT